MPEVELRLALAQPKLATLGAVAAFATIQFGGHALIQGHDTRRIDVRAEIAYLSVMPLCDAHNHLQDARLQAWMADGGMRRLSDQVDRVVVNGTRPEDWESVAALARAYPWVQPSFGLHPWFSRQPCPDWQERLRGYLTAFPQAAVGEIGLDRWITDAHLPSQLNAFRDQWIMATDLGRPITVHCLRAFGLLAEELQSLPPAPRGYLLHSYSGSAEMSPQFAKSGAYFSVSPYFAHPRKAAQLQGFLQIPRERLLIETDAPDLWPPLASNPNPLRSDEGEEINDPLNLLVSCQLLAELLGESSGSIGALTTTNFHRLFS